MSETKLATKADLKEMYDRMLPYLGGSADAGFTPVGTIIAVMGVTAPANYLACNGQVVNIADYPELANYFLQQFGSKNKFGGDGTTTFGIPDLRGEFLRGTGTNSHTNQGSGAAVGVHQDGTTFPDVFINTSGEQIGVKSNSAKELISSGRDFQIKSDSSGTISNTIASATKSSTGSTRDMFTTRPTNTSVLFCIATKNIYLNPSNDYSTDEKVVGTWLDGKTIWQKTFITTFGEINVAKEIELDISAETIVSIDGMYSSIPTTITYWNPFNSFSSNMQYANKIWISTGQQTKLFVYTSHSDRVGENVVVTIRYTKTTS